MGISGWGMEKCFANSQLPYPNPVNGMKNIISDLQSLGIREEDLEESFIRSSGPGGQNVNKVSTCVVLVHRPTGIMVKAQGVRTQVANRREARQLLAQKIADMRAKEQSKAL